MSMSPKVSICIPIYNVENYVARCLDSVLNQSYRNIEIIIVDDCTPDYSMTIVEEYAATDARIRILRHEHNRGLMIARRTAYKTATGDYITFCDSDDVMPENAIQDLLSEALSSQADIVSGDMQLLYEDGSVKPSRLCLPYGNDAEGVYHALLSKEYSHTLWSKLFKSNLLQDHDYQTYEHATNGEDGILFYQVLQHVDKVVHVNKIVYSYFMNASSSTHVRLSKNGIKSILILNKLRMKMCGVYPNLRNLAWKYVSMVLNDLIASGYNRDRDIKQEIRTMGMGEYISFKDMMQHFDLRTLLFISLKRMIKPYLVHKL